MRSGCRLCRAEPRPRNQPTEDMWDFKNEEEDRDDSWDEEEDDWDEEEDYGTMKTTKPEKHMRLAGNGGPFFCRNTHSSGEHICVV